jgi:hypothetical protein
MKQKILFFMVFMAFAGTVSAYDSALSSLGWGFGLSDTASTSPLIYNLVDGAMYFQAPIAGNVSLTIRADAYSTIQCGQNYCVGMDLYGLNYSGETETWTRYDSVGVNNYNNPGMQNWSETFTAYSNVGIYKIAHTGGGNIYIYPESSFITYNGAPDLFARTYGAGTYATVPLVNKYYPQITTISGDPVDGQVISLGYNDTAWPYYLAPIFLSCGIPNGPSSAYVKNSNGTDPAHDWQMYYFNFLATAHKNIGFQYASDSNASTIYIPAGGSHTFVIGVNNSEALSGVGWYVSRQFPDGSFGSENSTIPAPDKNVSFTYAPSGHYGKFRVEAQLEDTYCVPHRFVTYTWYISLGASVSLSGYVSTGIMDTAVPNATVEISCPSGEADRLTTTDANGVYSFTSLGAGQYTLNVARTGYTCSACPDTFTLNATINGNNPYNRDYALVVANVTTTTTPFEKIPILKIMNVSDFTIGYDIFDVWASYKYNGLTISDASCTFYSANFDPSSDSLVSPYYEHIVGIVGPAGPADYSVTCFKTGYQTLTASDSFTVHDNTHIATDITWISEPHEAMVGVDSVYKIQFKDSSLTGIPNATCSLYAKGIEYDMVDLYDGYYRKYLRYSSTGAYNVYVLCSKDNYESAQTENITTVVSATTPTTILHTCYDGIKNNDETDVDCGGSCSKCARNQACKKNTDCLSNWCTSGLCKSPSCSDLIKNGDETGTDCGGSCGPCACFYISQCAQDGSEHCENYKCVRDYC